MEFGHRCCPSRGNDCNASDYEKRSKICAAIMILKSQKNYEYGTVQPFGCKNH